MAAEAPRDEEWLCDSNEAFTISLMAPTKDSLQLVSTFQPKFTHTFFGDEEQIFGYKDLKINLQYRANDMRPHLEVSYGKKYKGTGGVEPVKVAEILENGCYLPKVAFVRHQDFINSSKQMADSWTPPGTLHSTMERSDGTYEIWRGTLNEPTIKQLHARIQMFVPLFIDAGSYIGQVPGADPSELDLSDSDRWTVFFLYRKQVSTDEPNRNAYTFAGFSTVYRFYCFQPLTPPSSPSDNWELPHGNLDLGELPCRTRLSQFLILPPFQGKGLGARLYSDIFDHYQKHSQTQELTVEDPNEAFDDLRDICDLMYLESVPEFQNLRIDMSVKVHTSGVVPQLIANGNTIEPLRQKVKIATRQFSRVLEMHLMSKLPVSVQTTMALDDKPAASKKDLHQQKLWRLLVKQRLYRHNRDVLSQLEPPERVGKLDEVLSGVELEYARLLAAFERAKQHAKPEELRLTPNGKRKLEGETDKPTSKRARVEGA